MYCSILCEDQYYNIHKKFDLMSYHIIHSINKTSEESAKILIEMINQRSHELTIKTIDKLKYISHQHARLDSTSKILITLLNEPKDNLDNSEIVTIYNGFNLYTFIFIIIIGLYVGFLIEKVRLK
jgi:hypothetical protein